jgi:ketosteroid isomerase-like protein
MTATLTSAHNGLAPAARRIRLFCEAAARHERGELAVEALRPFLAFDAEWLVPGRSPLAGRHQGARAVLEHQLLRRELSPAPLSSTVADVLLGTLRTVALIEVYAGAHSWEEAHVFRLAGGRIAQCRVLPYDLAAFDRVWAA